MPYSNPITQNELQDLALYNPLHPRDGSPAEQYMPQAYFLVPPATQAGPVKWRLFDAAYITTGIIDPNRLGTGATGAGNLYLADDGTWKAVSGGGGGAVNRIIAGTNISISPAGGTGDVTINATTALVPEPTGYGSFYSNVSQTLSAANTPQAVTLGQTYEAVGTSTSGSRIYMDKAGTYQFSYVAQVANDANSQEYAEFWIKYNGVNYPNSNTKLILQPRKGAGNPSEQLMTLIISGTSLNDNDYIELFWEATSTQVSLKYDPANASYPATPSIIANIIPIGAQGRDSNLNELNDVLIATPSTGQLLRRDSDGLWKNWTPNFLTTVPTLDQVTTAGNTTTNSIGVGGIGATDNFVFVLNRTVNTVSVSPKLRWTGSNVGTMEVYGDQNRLVVTATSGVNASSFQGNFVNFGSSVGSVSSPLLRGTNNFTGGLFFIGGGGVAGNAGIGFSIGNYTEGMRLVSTGNLLIGTTTDSGYKLDVNGSGRVKGLDNSSSTTAFLVQNTGGWDNLKVTNDGQVSIGGDGLTTFPLQVYGNSGLQIRVGNSFFSYNAVRTISFINSNNGIPLNHEIVNQVSSTDNSNYVYFRNQTIQTAGSNSDWTGVSIETIVNTQTSVKVTQLSITPTYNLQANTTSASIQRGIYYNPTITTLQTAIHRAIETTSGNVIFNGGNVGIGTVTPLSKLHIETSTSDTEIFRAINPGGGASVNRGAGIIVTMLNTQVTGGRTRIRQYDTAGYAPRNYIEFVSGTTGFTTEGSTTISGYYEVGLVANNALRLLVKPTGNILIGTTTDSVYKLDVVGADSRFNGVRVGLGAGGVSTNTVVGNGALSANSTGSSITAIGYRALYNNTASGNTAVGYEAALTNTSGVNITAFGERALRNSTGSENSAFGTIALFTNTTGIQNTAVGRAALFSNSTGGTNTGVGYNALFANSTGNSNTAIGWRSLSSNTGSNNTALGLEAGFSGVANTTGANNIFIGYQSTGVSATESNRTWIGNSSTTSTWLAGNVLVGTTTDAGFKLDVNGTARSNALYVQNGIGDYGVRIGTTSRYAYTPLTVETSAGSLSFGTVAQFTQSRAETTYVANYDKPTITLANVDLTADTWTTIQFSKRTDTASGIAGIGAQYKSSSNSDLAFFTKGSNTFSEKMRITGVGNVGIGTTTPAYKLQVQGTVSAVLTNATHPDVVYYNNTTGELTYGAAPTGGGGGGNFVIDYDYNIVGAKDGINTNFSTTVPYILGTTRVYLNGQRLTPGVGYDYLELNPTQISLFSPPVSSDQLIIEYETT